MVVDSYIHSHMYPLAQFACVPHPYMCLEAAYNGKEEDPSLALSLGYAGKVYWIKCV